MDDPVDAGLGRGAVEPAPRSGCDAQVATCARHDAAISSRASICDSPERLSAILMKLTPCLPCRRTSVTISSAVLHSLPIEWSGVPSHDGSSSSMQP